MDADTLIELFELKPHPEGGYYRETYRSDLTVTADRSVRSAGTAILYLLSGSDVSRFHRIDADEIWHYHQGGPLEIHSLRAGGSHRVDRLEPSNPQIVIPAGVWFGAKLAEPLSHCLAGCTVSPAFEFSGFELAERDDLLAEWPEADTIIQALT
ncbi:MAG: cupin domain-containing protein [Litorimonas sp.]